MSKTSVLLDLDYTLLDADKLKQRLFAAAAKGMSVSSVRRLYEISKRSGLFSPASFAETLSAAGLPIRGPEEFGSLFRRKGAYNYPGAEKFLKSLKLKGYDLYLISYGDEKYQRLKVRQSGLGRYFAKILITRQVSKEDALRRLWGNGTRRALLLDDMSQPVAVAKGLGFSAWRLKHGRKDAAYYSALLKRVNKILGVMR